MFGKISFSLTIVLFSALLIFPQVTDLEEKNPESINGIEYGYFIKNEQVKSVKRKLIAALKSLICHK